MIRSIASSLVVLSLGLLAGGCASVEAKGGFDQVKQAASQRLGQRVEWNQNSAEDKAAAEAVQTLLHRPLSADDAVQVALLNNRRLQATYEDLGVAQAALVRAGLLKNPRLSGDYLPAVSAGAAPVIGLGLVENFLDVFFIGLRKRIAGAEFDEAKNRVTAAVLEMAGRTRVAFLEFQAAQQLLEFRKASSDAASLAADAGQKFFDAGNITPLALAGERATAGQARLDLATAEAAAVAHQEALNRLMGLSGPDAADWRAAGGLPELPKEEIDLRDLETRAIAQSVDLAQARARVAAAAERAGVAQWSMILADLDVGIAAAREDDRRWRVGPSLSLQVPIFDQGQAGSAEAAGELRRALRIYAARAIELRSAARAARDQLAAARERTAYCRETLLPALDETLHQSLLQYNAMQTGIFQLLAARREQADAGARGVESLRDYWVARAELELILAGRNPLDADTLASAGE